MALTNAPGPALLQQAAALHRAGRLAEAEALYRRVLAQEPAQPDANHNLGAALAQQGKLSAALPFLKRALELRPSQPKYWTVMIEVLVASGDLDGAAATYRRLIAQQPGLAPLHYNLGNLLVRMGRAKEAADCFRAAVALDPQLARAHNNLGNLLKLEGQFDEAQASYRAAIAADPLLADAHANLGTVLERLGDLKAAEACHRTVIALAPQYPGIERSLGGVLLEQGRPAEALEAFLRHAERNASSGEPPSPHKERHDAGQRAWLGRPPADGLHLEGGDRLAGDAVNRGNDAAAIAAAWKASDPKLVVIDDLLTPEGLAALRRLCLGSNFWRQSFANGYLGAVPEHGFAAPLLAQIGEELAGTFPAIFEGHPLLQLWAFKYDSRLSGINLHADFAAVNVNFWITPDEANLDPEHGGLVIWDKAAPLDWDFDRYNNDQAAMRHFLESSGAKAITVPYRANRAIIFDSDLFHETDRFQFREGYENRRINVTYLYGWRAAGQRA